MSDVCLCLSCGGVGGVGVEWRLGRVLGPGYGRLW